MQSLLVRLGLGAAVLLSTGACAVAVPIAGPLPVNAFVAPAPTTTDTLRVALFPYIPDVAGDSLQGLQDSITARFQRANPNVTLQLRPMRPADNAFYSVDSVQTWLGSQQNGAGYHVVELDALMLGDLAQVGLLQPWASIGDTTGWVPGIAPAVIHNGQVYGMPHWLCSDFILTRDSATHAAVTVDSLYVALNRTANAMKLSGAVNGSWTLPALYLHAWADMNGPAGMKNAIDPQNLDPFVLQQMRRVLDLCGWRASGNACLMTPADSAIGFFATDSTAAFLGFSERLTAVMMNPAAADTDAIRLSAAPLGPGGVHPGNLPVLYVDALVLGRDCVGACQTAARAFADFLLSDATYQWILTSADAGPGKPSRYLTPATRSAFQVAGVNGDRLFQDIWNAIQGAAPLPNETFAAYRLQMKAELLDELNTQ